MKQNLGHIRAIRGNLAQYSNIQYYPIVVFCGDSELKVNSSYPVIKPKYLLKAIKQVQKDHISVDLRDEIYCALLRLNGNQPNITPKLYDEKHEPRNFNCPLCNGLLKKRMGKHGSFLGCSNFPDCRYTQRV